jgi:hypothetical protein
LYKSVFFIFLGFCAYFIITEISVQSNA